MKIKNALEKHKRALLKKKNVVGVGIGEKWTNGKNTGEEALLVFVSEKEKDTKKLKPKDVIPKSVEGNKTDVVGRTGVLKAQALTSRVRPLKAGYSCGHKRVTAGTIGGWFKDRDGDLVGLSNNHVIANTNRTAIGAATVQPGVYDARNWPANKVGALKRFVRIKRRNNLQDSAIFKPSVEVDLDTEIVGPVTGWNENLQVGDWVQKLGRTTGHTTAKVIATNATVYVYYGRKALEFDDQIITGYMSEGGDSGSLLRDMEGNAAGLLFAGSNTVTIHNKISHVKNTYGLEIYTPVQEALSHTVLVDGVETDLALNGVKDVSRLVSELKKLAAGGAAVNLTISYQVSPPQD